MAVSYEQSCRIRVISHFASIVGAWGIGVKGGGVVSQNSEK